MATAAVAPFEKGTLYTRGQIHEAVGGSKRAALVTRGGSVVCLCVTPRRNPRAPDEVLVGSRERDLRLARGFAASGASAPVFVRARRGGWTFAGDRRVRALVEEPGALLALVAEGAPPDTALALLLEETAAPPQGAPAAGT